MASFLSNILSMFSGGSKDAASATSSAEPQAYGDCTIHATPIREGNQFRLAGRIEKEVNGEVLVRNFVRADVFTSMDDAVEFTVRKAQQIIDQNGVSLFADGEKSRSA
ncbi:HlyU family transcriptional regulator [Rhizobium sp. LCM 4573]|uniref:HlyU family transcriptional regulator n=1 Tax=Rhizobium sp. LCM 4573 TaxID=1848291 RepID=UPI0008DA5A3F|nr:HlyU family transcriptional regulator [Rhizobium sp. LCM 4573]OHV76521.1 transcriptional activator HlyU [Rhizobium sp. LCM 4573]